MSLIEKKEKYFPLQSCIIFIIIAIIIIIIIAIICRDNWKCRKSASCCIKEESERGKTAGSTVSFVKAAATPYRRPFPHPIATSFRTPWLNTSGTHFYIIFDRPTRLESRSTLETRSSSSLDLHVPPGCICAVPVLCADPY